MEEEEEEQSVVLQMTYSIFQQQIQQIGQLSVAMSIALMSSITHHCWNIQLTDSPSSPASSAQETIRHPLTERCHMVSQRQCWTGRATS